MEEQGRKDKTLSEVTWFGIYFLCNVHNSQHASVEKMKVLIVEVLKTLPASVLMKEGNQFQKYVIDSWKSQDVKQSGVVDDLESNLPKLSSVA